LPRLNSCYSRKERTIELPDLSFHPWFQVIFMIEIKMSLIKESLFVVLLCFFQALSVLWVVPFPKAEGAKAASMGAGDGAKEQRSRPINTPTLGVRQPMAEDRLTKLSKRFLFVPSFSYSSPSSGLILIK